MHSDNRWRNRAASTRTKPAGTGPAGTGPAGTGPAGEPGARRCGASLASLSLSTALAGALLSGCGAHSMAPAPVVGQASEATLRASAHTREIAAAEAAALADPASAAIRLALGNAYLRAGRFVSAEAAFADALALGEASPRAALSLALARIAQGKYAEGANLLNEWDGAIAKADLGLALALAGQPERGIHIMANAIRAGENTVKMRQNLAYAYAVAGRWREARLMAQEDLPAHEVHARMEQWAAMASADAYQRRVASLLQVPFEVADSGQPVQLALAGKRALAAGPALPAAGSRELAAAEPLAGDPAPPVAEAMPAPRPLANDRPVAIARAPVPASSAALSDSAPARQAPAARSPAARSPAARPGLEPASAPLAGPSQPVDAFREAFRQSHAPGPLERQATGPIAPAPSASPELVFISQPLVQPPVQPPVQTLVQALPAGPTQGAGGSPAGLSGTHLVQLGSFSSEAGARRAWQIYTARFPALAGHELVITRALVNGRDFWRVSAAGFNQNASRAMCSNVRARSKDGCIAWAASRPLPGAIHQGADPAVLLAQR